MYSIHSNQSANIILAMTEPLQKVRAVKSLYAAYLNNVEIIRFTPNLNTPKAGFPEHLNWVEPKQLKQRGIGSEKGRCALMHAVAHIEFNAINLALDAVCRFDAMPEQYYIDWLQVAVEEAYHFELISLYLSKYGAKYGDFPVHNGLWEMAERTAYDVLARMACVPRLMEARGLDVAPMMRDKLLQAGDEVAAGILEIIFQDEKSHVKVGNEWYSYLCQQRKLDPMDTFIYLVHQHASDYLRGPYNTQARLEAGFTQDELAWIGAI